MPMELATKFVHVMNNVKHLDKVCNDLDKEECRPVEYYQECSKAIKVVSISLEVLKQAYQEKITGVL